MNWDEYFISIAEQVASKSKDPSTKTGCVIVDSKHRPVSFGYNGFIAGCDENKMTNERPMKYHLVIHAEMNALMFAKRNLEDCILYTLYAPCENCLKHILQAGIKTIIYKNPVVQSKTCNAKNSMSTYDTNEAITRLLQSLPDVICKNINGNNYLDEIWTDCGIPQF
ncbi:MAG: dCMP deaminase family protein [Alphaproteobacteria bacterium]|nr:dCMP deaminase family protein [Alphaproteobacteria bacterium]